LGMRPAASCPQIDQGTAGYLSLAFSYYVSERSVLQCWSCFGLPLITSPVFVDRVDVLLRVLQACLDLFQIIRLFSNVLDLVNPDMSSF